MLLGAGVVGVISVEGAVEVGPAAAAGVDAPSIPSPPLIDLGALMVPPPAGFDQIPDARLVVGGSADAERLVAERSDKERSRAVFLETGLLSGYVRAWQRPSTAELVTVRLYQFKDAEGARSYANRIVAVMLTAPATKFTIPAATGAVGIDTQVAQGANRLVYVVGRKDRLVAAIAATVVPPPDGGFLALMARSQLSLLPS